MIHNDIQDNGSVIMRNVTNNPIMLGIIVLSVVMLSVMAPSFMNQLRCFNGEVALCRRSLCRLPPMSCSYE
jgi:hypothetical protein